MNRQRLLERFLRYVRMDTTARPDADCFPSSPGQLELGRLMVAELHAMGLTDAAQDGHGIVMATSSATASGWLIGPRKESRVARLINLHLDAHIAGHFGARKPPAPGVRPQVIQAYAGGDIVLPGDPRQVIRVSENPELSSMIGKTLITTDGTTLLGADDKAGLAVIMEMAQSMLENPRLARPTVRLCFTCDEEVGHGVDKVDLKKLGATVCYTLDGPGAGEMDVETFSADGALVRVRGANIHPSVGKGRIINAIRVAADFVERLPRDRLAPEVTDGRQGFLHPYILEGGVAEVRLKVLLRDFDAGALAAQADLLRSAAAAAMAKFPGSSIEVKIETQYRNLAAGLALEPRSTEYVRRAYQRLGRKLTESSIRGGTDGSRFTELGLPTPNLSTGQHNPHCPIEWACLDEMVEAVEVLVELVQVWAEG